MWSLFFAFLALSASASSFPSFLALLAFAFLATATGPPPAPALAFLAFLLALALPPSGAATLVVGGSPGGVPAACDGSTGDAGHGVLQVAHGQPEPLGAVGLPHDPVAGLGRAWRVAEAVSCGTLHHLADLRPGWSISAMFAGEVLVDAGDGRSFAISKRGQRLLHEAPHTWSNHAAAFSARCRRNEGCPNAKRLARLPFKSLW